MTEQSVAVQTAQTPASLKVVEPKTLFDRINQMQQAIARRAFELFEGDGGLFGRDLEHWFKAEAELLHPVHVSITEADDALASAARIAAGDARVAKVSIWTPDKDLAQCVRDERVVQVDRRTRQIRDAAAVRRTFGVEPHLIPDLLALAGDAADGYPGLPGIGRKTAARLIEKYGPLEDFPATVLGERRELALLFKNLATLRTDAALFADVDELKWRGARSDFAGVAARLGEPRLATRAGKVRLP